MSVQKTAANIIDFSRRWNVHIAITMYSELDPRSSVLFGGVTYNLMYFVALVSL